MVGNYLNNNMEHESRIRSWMLAVVKDGGIDRYDDLHLDRIEPRWKDPKTWIPAGLHAFDLALNIRDLERLSFSVVLGFSLKSSIERKRVKFGAKRDVENDLGQTPPSLYLFRPGQEPWAEAAHCSHNQKVTIENVNPAIFGASLRVKQCFYFEFRNDTEEHSRSILLAG